MGVGKTCTAVAVAEQFIRVKKEQRSEYPTTTLKKIVILTKGKGLHGNFINEIAHVCTDGQYLEGVDEQKYVKDRYKRIVKNVKVQYTFNTFEIFAKNLKGSNNAKKARDYEDSLFIVDEAHNLRLTDVVERGIYTEISGLFELLKRKKVLLLTGTPMKDKPEEIVDLLNLIVKDKLTPKDLTDPELFKKKITGYISYLKASSSEVERIDVGSLLGDLKHLKVHTVTMSDFQSRVYSEAIRQDGAEKSIFSGSRQASSAVFPDGTFGKTGFETNMVQSSTGFKFRSRETAVEMQGNLAKYTAKYADLVTKLADDYANNRLSFVFSEFVKGSGLLMLSVILELNGYVRVVDGDSITTEAKRYAVFTNDTSTISQTRKVIGLFNHPKNMGGRYISTILGSRVIMEGFSFKNIQSEYVLTPHWNYSETSQIIARGFRAGSHNDLLKAGIVPNVKVYHYATIPPNSAENSIDLHMYEIAEKKDFAIQKVVKLLKEAAVDCSLNKKRNTVTDVRLNNTRECEYTACDYKCDSGDSSRLDDPLRNYALVYNRYSTEYEHLKMFITNELKTGTSLSLDEIVASSDRMKMPMSKFEIASMVNDMLESNTVLFDRPEGCGYLRVENDVLYTSTRSPFPRIGFRYDSIFTGKSIDEMVYADQQEFVVELVRKIFQSKNLKQLQSYLAQAPLYLQEKLLCYSINSKSSNRSTTRKGFVAEMILNNYKLYFAIVPDRYAARSENDSDDDDDGDDCKAFVWLNEEHPTCTSDLSNPNAWRKCTNDMKERVKVLKTMNRNTAVASNPYGYVGLINRLTNDFCLRRVDEADTGSAEDKRKRNVGKRCQNWKKTDLVDLVANRLRIEPDESDFEVDVAELRRDPRVSKLVSDLDTEDVDGYKRVAFWSVQRVDHMCDKIMERLDEEHLTINDPNCGTTKKVR